MDSQTSTFEAQLISAWSSHHVVLKRYVLTRIRIKDDAEDIVSECFVRLAKQSEFPQSVKAWLFRVANHLIIDTYRANSTFMTEDVREGQEDSTPYQQLIPCVRPLLARLSSPYAETIQLTELERIPQKKVAELYSVSLPAIKSRVQRGRQRLEKELRRCCQLNFTKQGRLYSILPKEIGCC